ncbi:MAG: septation protein A [Pseudomonadota bacterium]
MSETSRTAGPETDTENRQQEQSPGQVLLELGPLLVFFIANWKAGIFWATGLFMAATIIALTISYGRYRKVPIMPLVSGVFVIGFGGLTLFLQDDLFIKVKPTIVNLLFAGLLAGGLWYGRIFLKIVFARVFHLDDEGWRILTIRWIGFFIVLAILNEIIWRSVSTDMWVNFKVFGIMPLTFAFSLAQLPLIKRHSLDEQN